MAISDPCEESRQSKEVINTWKGISADSGRMRPPRKCSLGRNFSYPRPEQHKRRQESSDSRSSLTSNGSVPGMTDSDESDVSLDEDYHYNNSASELWDTFWPDNALLPEQQQDPAVWPNPLHQDHFDIRSSRTRRLPQDTRDDTVQIAQLRPVDKPAEVLHNEGHEPQPSPPQPASPRGPVSYSVYPKPSLTDTRRVQLPPRTSSLSTEPPSPPSPPRHLPFLRASKSSAALKSTKPQHKLQPLNIPRPPPEMLNSATVHAGAASKSLLPPATITSSTGPKQTTLVPVTPAYPPPLPPSRLRPSASTSHLRPQKSQPNLRQAPTHTINSLPPTRLHVKVQSLSNNPTPSLSPLLPPFTAQCKQVAQQRPQAQRFVSVFELDSDGEPEGEKEGHNGFAKRFALGVRKKNAGDKSGNGKTIATAATAKVGLMAVGGNSGTSFCTDGVAAPHDEGGDEAAMDGVKGTEKESEKGGHTKIESPQRKRGGSLGRIFGLMGR